MCYERIANLLEGERTVYRTVQYGDIARVPPWQTPAPWRVDQGTFGDGVFAAPRQLYRSVLGQGRASTSDLVPYLTANYSSLSCRLHLVCGRVRQAAMLGSGGVLLPFRPLGCSRYWTVRTRTSVSAEERPQVPRECSPLTATGAVRQDAQAELTGMVAACQDLEQAILQEERALLETLTVVDASARTLRPLLAELRAVLGVTLSELLAPLRDLLEQMSVVHTVPCLLSQCD